ncbi:MAG TPA: hypothetical protein VK733_04400 [Gemmatimonadaceae bacterium]|jgi:hypothetical protein|nr:hypothetical protein [Gemmatimonadaceae bacterium]
MRIAARSGMMTDKESRSREPVVPTVDPKEKTKADQKKAKRRELGGDADRGLDTGEFEPFDDKRAPDSGT